MGDRETIIDDLRGRFAVKRRKACILAAQSGDAGYCDALLEALRIEQGSTSWQTRVEIVKAIGLLKCSDARDHLRMIMFNQALDVGGVRRASALAYVRLARNGLAAVSPVLEVLENGDYSSGEGALEALGYDRMIPSEDDCAKIIQKVWDYGSDRPKGYTDPRYGLAAACAGWKTNRVKEFLEHCLTSADVPLVHVAKSSLQQKYIRLR